MRLTKRKVGVLVLLTLGVVIAMAVPALADPSTDAPGKANLHANLGVSLNLLWIVIGGVLVIFMQAGFALVETGFTRAKNAAHVFSTNFAIFGLGFVGYYLVGYAIMFSGYSAPGVFGLEKPLSAAQGLIHFGSSGHWNFFWARSGFGLSGTAYGAATMAYFLYMVAFMDTTATIPTGAMAERWKWKAFVGWGLFCGALYYPLFGAWTWGGGWLSQLGNSLHLGLGYTDFAGSGVVHAMGGIAGLAGALVLGPRLGKYAADKTPKVLAGHNIPFAQLGTFILLVGWFGFNAASTLSATDVRFAVIATNTAIAAAFGATIAMFYCMAIKRFRKPDPGMMANGMLAGLVAITAPCAFVQPWAAATIGSVAAVIVVESCLWLEKRGVDDPVGAISVHGTCGIWGVLSVGIFADGRYGKGWNLTTAGPGGKASGVTGILYDFGKLGFGQLGSQAIGSLVIIFVMGGFAFLFFKIQNRVMKGGIRPPAAIEEAGLDIPEMGVLAYDQVVVNEIDVVGPEGAKVLAKASGGSPDPSIGR